MAKRFWLPVEKKKISNGEWILVIALLFVIDVIQFLLDALGIGLAANRVIDVGVGALWAFYLQIRGQTMMNTKRMLSFLSTFILEEIPVLDALPWWSADGVYMMTLSKADDALHTVDHGVTDISHGVKDVSKTLRQRGVAVKRLERMRKAGINPGGAKPQSRSFTQTLSKGIKRHQELLEDAHSIHSASRRAKERKERMREKERERTDVSHTALNTQDSFGDVRNEEGGNSPEETA